MTKIAIGSDHAAFKLKEKTKEWLKAKGFSVEDLGTHSEESADYPDYAKKVAKEVASGKADFGVLICGTGIGMSMAANKGKGVRAAVCHDAFSGRMAREHNDANVLCFGARTTDEEQAKEIVDKFFSTDFAGAREGGERHLRRVKKIED